jgi:molybdopterin/thiamine biosynthesis adenylyltransferase
MTVNKYSRQELFTPIGARGQKLIRQKTALIIGVGALGSTSAEMLVRGGIGKVILIDRDYVDVTNLQRQQLYTEADVIEVIPKALAAERRLRTINSDVEIETHIIDASSVELEKIIPYVDIIVDGTDNFETRLIINDLSFKYQIPWIFGACVGSYGMSYTFVPGKTICFSCLMEQIPMQGATCDVVGVIAPIVQMVASYQVVEAIKLLVGAESNLRKTLVTFDLWHNQNLEINLAKAKKENCASCGPTPNYPYITKENLTKIAVLCGRETVQIRPPKNIESINLDNIKEMLETSGKKVNKNEYLLVTEVEGFRIILFKDARMLIHGTKDQNLAKMIYQKLLG